MRAHSFPNPGDRLANKRAQADPTVLDEIDLAAHTRELARTYGIRAPELRPEAEVIRIAQARLEAQQQAEQQAAAMQAAETTSKFDPSIQRQIADGAMEFAQ